jgi:transcriptional regulator with XRE-family HTH domain
VYAYTVLNVTDETDGRWAAWLSGQLNRKGWRVSDLNHASRVSGGIISRWLNGQARQPGLENARKIAAALDVPLLEVLVEAELLTEAEAGAPPRPEQPDVTVVPTDVLLRELGARLGFMLVIRPGGGERNPRFDLGIAHESEPPEDPEDPPGRRTHRPRP